MISASTRIHGVFWSEDIFQEWLRVAPREGLARLENVVRFQTIMNTMFQDALIPRKNYERLIDQMTNDKGDRHVLAAAVSQDEVGIIVTHNRRHFSPESVDRFGLEVQTPDEFVRNQAELNPLNFLQAFLKRAERRNELALRSGRNPLTPEDIAIFLRDGPANMIETGNYILELLG